MPESKARVGVVIRTQARPIMLSRALADVCAQSYANWQVVIVNDGGNTDQVEAAYLAVPEQYRNQVEIVHHSDARGRSAAANAGITALSTEYAVLHDDDDLWHPDFLARTVAWLDDNPQDIGVVVRTEIVYEQLVNGALERSGQTPFWPDLTGINYAQLLQVNRFVPIAYLYRREVHAEVGMYREDIHAAEDWEFNLRVASKHRIGFVADQTLAYWMQRPQVTGALGNSMFVLADEHETYDRLIRDEALRKYVAEYGDGLPLFLARMVQDEVSRQLDDRRTLGQRVTQRLQKWRRGRKQR